MKHVSIILTCQNWSNALLLPTLPLTPNSLINLLLLTMFQVKLTTPSDALQFLKAQVNHYSTILSSLILYNSHFNFDKYQYFTSNLVGFVLASCMDLSS